MLEVEGREVIFERGRSVEKEKEERFWLGREKESEGRWFLAKIG